MDVASVKESHLSLADETIETGSDEREKSHEWKTTDLIKNIKTELDVKENWK